MKQAGTVRKSIILKKKMCIPSCKVFIENEKHFVLHCAVYDKYTNIIDDQLPCIYCDAMLTL